MQGKSSVLASAPAPTGRSFGGDALLTPSEVAALFRVNPKTVARWAKSGKLSSIRTLGGHRRFRAAEVRRALQGGDRERGA
jgi:excisionase family DNA binding protein